MGPVGPAEVTGANHGPPAYQPEPHRQRQKELEYIRKMMIYTKVPLEECYRNTGKALIQLRWIDTNKSNSEEGKV